MQQYLALVGPWQLMGSNNSMHVSQVEQNMAEGQEDHAVKRTKLIY